MQTLTKRLPSPAMVVACTALTIALGGTAWAATLPRNSVGTAQLKRNAVTSIKVRNNALTGADIRESRLGRVPSASRALTANSAATATTANSATTATNANSAPVSRLDYSATTTVSVPGTGAPTVGTVNCPTGLNATGGGAKVADSVGGNLIDTNPVGKTAWEARAFSNSATTMTVYVICAQAATTTP
jgi:hypothetical protein